MKLRWQSQWRLTAVAFDAATFVIVMGGAALLRFGPRALDYAAPGASSFSDPWLLAAGFWVASMGVFGLYSPTRCSNGVEEARRIVSACVAAPGAFLVFSFLLKTQPSRLWLGTSTLGAIVGAGVERRVLRRLTTALRERGRWTDEAVVVGSFDAKILVDNLMMQPAWGVVPVATCGFIWGELPHYELNEIAAAVDATDARIVAVVAGSLPREVVQESVASADDLGVGVLLVPGLDYTLLHNLHLVSLGIEPALALERPSLQAHQRILKRAIDISVSAVSLVLLAPLLAVIALAVRLESPGGALFQQKRVGLHGREIVVRKFRSMIANAHELQKAMIDEHRSDPRMIKFDNDPRVTRVGRILRKTSLDELPQLWNILMGDMSLVGPRPAQAIEVELYHGHAIRRLTVRPGLTGLWQINGRSDLAFEEYVRMDLTYIQNWGLLLDLYILLRTVPAVLRSKGAY